MFMVFFLQHRFTILNVSTRWCPTVLSVAISQRQSLHLGRRTHHHRTVGAAICLTDVVDVVVDHPSRHGE